MENVGIGPKWQDAEYCNEYYPQTVQVELTGETMRERIDQCSPNARRLLTGLYEAFEEAIEIPNHMLRPEFRDTRNGSSRGRSLRWLRAQQEGEFYDDTEFGDEIEPEVPRTTPVRDQGQNLEFYVSQDVDMKNETELEFVDSVKADEARRNFLTILEKISENGLF